MTPEARYHVYYFRTKTDDQLELRWHVGVYRSCSEALASTRSEPPAELLGKRDSFVYYLTHWERGSLAGTPMDPGRSTLIARTERHEVWRCVHDWPDLRCECGRWIGEEYQLWKHAGPICGTCADDYETCTECRTHLRDRDVIYADDTGEILCPLCAGEV